MSGEPLFSVQVPISALTKIYPALVAVSGALPEFLEAKCIACGARLSADDLQQLADEKKSGERLERIRLEYCARRTCESRFYRVTLRGDSVEVQAVLESFQVTLVQTVAKPRPVLTVVAVLKMVCVLFAVGYALFILHHLYYGERIPLWQKRHFY
jgi:hypothetical protein